MSNQSRTATVKLPDSLIQEIASKLNIQDTTRIPHHLVVNTVDLKNLAAHITQGANVSGLSIIHITP